MGWGFLSDIGDAVGDAAGAVGNAVSNAAESAYDNASTSWLGDAIAWGADAVDTATFGLASDAMNVADDYVFDSVDYLTGGAVNVDFDDGKFSVGAGFDGLAHIGASVGEAGITADGSVPGAAFGVGMTDQGFSANGAAGIDWGPLPYAAGHVKIDANGDISVNGEIQGTIPTPYGLLSGEVSGGFVSTDQGWGAFVDADGTLRMPSGTTIRGGIEAMYEETADGSHASVGVEGSVSMPGMGTVGGAAGYERIEQDGNVVETFHAEGEVDALGMNVSGEADYLHAQIDGVETSEWSGDVDFDGPNLASAVGAAASLAGAGSAGGADDNVLGFDEAVPMDDFSQDMAALDDVESSFDQVFDELGTD